jgi:hypothetical protein
MAKSLFESASSLPRGILVFAVLTLISGFVFHSEFAYNVLAQEPTLIASAVVGSDTAKAAPTAAASAPAAFLELASAVGETEPAKRLIEYKLKNDPSSRERYWAIVDFNQPSTSKRLYVFDAVEKKVERYYVAHGRGSEGTAGNNIPAIFSNQSGSNSSSLGIYRALDEYNGHHGRSLRLEGLEPTNSNALSRAVVMHTADYVSEAFIRETGRIGRSEGCFAVERSVGNTLIDELKDGAYIIASKD